ncbi:hypothetical protein HK405_001745, partial [Cladochytrium tenue]
HGDGLEAHVASAAEHFNERFAEVLAGVVDRHNDIVLMVARNMRRLGEQHGFSEGDVEVQHFLDRFHRTRVGMRLLVGHHLGLSRPNRHDASMVGIVSTATDPGEVAAEAAEDAAAVCEANYGAAPRVEIGGGPGLRGRAVPRFVFVPSHLHHMLFEVIKNAMRASVERAEQTEGVEFLDAYSIEPVRVTIEEENEGKAILIRVSDRGVGISVKNLPKVFQYSYTTASLDQDTRLGSEMGSAPLAGYGYGLPLSRLV